MAEVWAARPKGVRCPSFWRKGDGLGAHVAEDGAAWGDLAVEVSARRGREGLMRRRMGPHEMDSVVDEGFWDGKLGLG